jgi:hypothetical protein
MAGKDKDRPAPTLPKSAPLKDWLNSIGKKDK